MGNDEDDGMLSGRQSIALPSSWDIEIVAAACIPCERPLRGGSGSLQIFECCHIIIMTTSTICVSCIFSTSKTNSKCTCLNLK